MEWLIKNDQVTKVVCAFTAPTRASQRLVFSEYYESGRIEAELVPQGTLAERMRAAGASIPAFYATPAAVSTELAEGHERASFNGREYLLEEALPLDYAFIRAAQADAFKQSPFRARPAQLQPDHGDGRPGDDRRGRRGHPAARHHRPGRRAPVGYLRPPPGQGAAAARRLVAHAPRRRCRPATPSSREAHDKARFTAKDAKDTRRSRWLTLEKLVRGCLAQLFKVHSAVGPGLLESAYETCLLYERPEKSRLRVRARRCCCRFGTKS